MKHFDKVNNDHWLQIHKNFCSQYITSAYWYYTCNIFLYILYDIYKVNLIIVVFFFHILSLLHYVHSKYFIQTVTCLILLPRVRYISSHSVIIINKLH